MKFELIKEETKDEIGLSGKQIQKGLFYLTVYITKRGCQYSKEVLVSKDNEKEGRKRALKEIFTEMVNRDEFE